MRNVTMLAGAVAMGATSMALGSDVGSRMGVVDRSVQHVVRGPESAESAFIEQFEDGLVAGLGIINYAAPGAVINLSSGAWYGLNVSSPIGGTGIFASGEDPINDPFPPAAGNGALFAAMNYNNGAGASNISTFLMSPVLTLQNGDTIRFDTRSTGSNFPDRLRVRVSAAGSSTTPGDFSNILLTINPNLVTGANGYPSTWTEVTATISGLAGAVSGRFAFHYDVSNGGPSGTNSDFVGIDNVRFAPVPEPTSLTLIGMVGAALLGRRRR